MGVDTVHAQSGVHIGRCWGCPVDMCWGCSGCGARDDTSKEQASFIEERKEQDKPNTNIASSSGGE